MEAEFPDARQQSARFWPRVWIYAGLSAAIPEPGDILPFTIADAGLHVERLADGALEARVNRAQQGGCLVIPQQCHGGTQLRCPQAACAFSRDRLATIDAATPERERLLRQFVGNRPDRLATIGVREDGGFIRIRMAGEDRDAEETVPDFLSDTHQSWWVEAAIRWYDLAQHLVSAAMEDGWSGRLHFPNLILLAGDGSRVAVILQPLGPNLTRCRIADAGAEAGREAVKRIIGRVQARAEGANIETDFNLRQAILRVCRSSSASPLSRPPPRRVTPSFGFIGG